MDRVDGAAHGLRSNLVRVYLHPEDHAQYVSELRTTIGDVEAIGGHLPHLGDSRWLIAVPGDVGRGSARVEVRDSLKTGDSVHRAVRFLAGC